MALRKASAQVVSSSVCKRQRERGSEIRREERERRLYERLLNEDISSDRSEVLSLIACDDNRNVPFVPPLVDAGAGPLLMQVQVRHFSFLPWLMQVQEQELPHLSL